MFPRSIPAAGGARVHFLKSVLALVGLMACGSIAVAAAAPGAPVAARRLLLDGVLAGPDVIAVGERGTILRSPDQGTHWERIESPTRATLTGVSFVPVAAPQLGWAVGHDAVILATADGGRIWTKPYQGENLQDSFLDVLALDAQRVIAVGAYGLAVVSVDGGQTWTRKKFTAEDTHFNRITRGPTGTLYLAGERGTLLRSENLGESWQPIASPYEGSFYGVLPLDARTLVAHGLRGHAYVSSDDGASWQAVSAPEPALLATAVRLKGGQLVFSGQARTLWVSRDQGRTLNPLAGALSTGVAELLELPNGNLLALGEAGATILPSP
jgi:photosystem II stability/assembly factor-like uncharacterized protein